MEQTECEQRAVEFEGAEGNVLAASMYSPTSGGADDHPPVILMHGGGQTRHSWSGAARRLAVRGNLAIAVDARGHGDSEWVESKNYSFHGFRDDLLQVAQQARHHYGSGDRPPVVVGASLGGISAMLAQAVFGDDSTEQLFSAIVLVDITPRMETSGVDKILGFMSRDLRKGFGTIDEAAEVIAAYLPDRSRPQSLNGLAKNLKQGQDGRWYWHWDPAFIDGPNHVGNGAFDSKDALVEAAAKITVPTLLVRGAKSELVTKQAVDEFLILVPHAQYVDVGDAGHMVAGDKNDVFASTVIEFLSGEGLA